MTYFPDTDSAGRELTPGVHVKLNYNPLPSTITLYNATTGEYAYLPVLPCGCVSECSCHMLLDCRTELSMIKSPQPTIIFKSAKIREHDPRVPCKNNDCEVCR